MTLRILAEAYEGSGIRSPLGEAEGQAFKKAVVAAFEKLLEYPFGVELGKAIAAADHDLVVVKTAPGQFNCCGPERRGAKDLDNACYQELLKAKTLRDKIQQLLSASTPGFNSEHPAVRKFVKFYVGKDSPYDRVLGKDDRKDSYPFAHKNPDQRIKAMHKADAVMQQRVDLPLIYSMEEVQEAADTVRALRNGLIGYHLMPHLTPGPGVPAFVAWDPDVQEVGTDFAPEDRAPWMKRPAWLALAHELIHGWRLVSGECVFRPSLIEDYYEEAMTVGLPPYDGCTFTENKLRRASGEPLRTFYGPSTRVKSDKAQEKHKSVEKRLA